MHQLSRDIYDLACLSSIISDLIKSIFTSEQDWSQNVFTLHPHFITINTSIIQASNTHQNRLLSIHWQICAKRTWNKNWKDYCLHVFNISYCYHEHKSSLSSWLVQKPLQETSIEIDSLPKGNERTLMPTFLWSILGLVPAKFFLLSSHHRTHIIS